MGPKSASSGSDWSEDEKLRLGIYVACYERLETLAMAKGISGFLNPQHYLYLVALWNNRSITVSEFLSEGIGDLKLRGLIQGGCSTGVPKHTRGCVSSVHSILSVKAVPQTGEEKMSLIDKLKEVILDY